MFHLSSSCFYPSSALRFLDELLFLRANRLSSLAAERLLNLSRCNGMMWGKRLAALHVTFTCHWLTLDVFVNLLAASVLPYTFLYMYSHKGNCCSPHKDLWQKIAKPGRTCVTSSSWVAMRSRHRPSLSREAKGSVVWVL